MTPMRRARWIVLVSTVVLWCVLCARVLLQMIHYVSTVPVGEIEDYARAPSYQALMFGIFDLPILVALLLAALGAEFLLFRFAIRRK